jgi:cytochrome c-type biogenesis protein CcmH
MTVFWSLAAVMVMVALLFLLPPLLRSRKLSAISRDDLNTEIIKSQFAELDADLAAGKLDQTQYASARSDLEQELLYDLKTDGPAQHEPRSGRWATLLIIPLLPLCAVLLYQQIGSVELIDRLQQSRTMQSQSPPQAATKPTASIDEMVARLAARLQEQPDDLKGWVMLARSYTILKRYGEAEAAYENVLRLGGENADLLADYADAMVMTNGGRFTDRSGALLTQALELDPDNLKGLWLAGHWKNQTGAPAEALAYWQQAAAQLPAGSEDAAVIAQQISRVQAQLGITGEPPPVVATVAADTGSTAATSSASGATLNVEVALAPELAATAAAEDTVFIFARATQGPRMPLAIVRKQVKDLPVTVTLDDSQAMMPAMKLSNFEQVAVGARVSKTGNAMPQSGDLQGVIASVSTHATEKIQITISSKVP